MKILKAEKVRQLAIKYIQVKDKRERANRIERTRKIIDYLHHREERQIRRKKRAVRVIVFELREGKYNMDLTDSQRAQLLLLYKSKLQSLGDEVFFDRFDSIRCQCYSEIGIDLEEMEATERSKAASKLGKHGGESTSEAKSQAARENGKRGGRKKRETGSQFGLNLEDI